jgi:hypothetical protein
MMKRREFVAGLGSAAAVRHRSDTEWKAIEQRVPIQYSVTQPLRVQFATLREVYDLLSNSSVIGSSISHLSCSTSQTRLKAARIASICSAST